MIRTVIGLLIPALVFLPQQTAAAELSLEASACDSHQRLAPGDVLKIRLPSNPTTGYLWQVTALPSLLSQSGEPKHIASDRRYVGGGGVTTFTFRASARQGGILELAYRRPWETNNSPLRICRLTVEELEEVR